MSSVSTRLVRLLNLVPYFQANPRITYAEASVDLGLTPDQLRKELQQLWMCGLPGLHGGDLIDIVLAGDNAIVVGALASRHRPRAAPLPPSAAPFGMAGPCRSSTTRHPGTPCPPASSTRSGSL